MENLNKDFGAIKKAYGAFLVCIYFMYMIFLVMVMKGDAILEWFSKKLSWIRKKFRKETDET